LELEDCLKLLKPALYEKALSVELKIETDFAQVNADRTRSRRVFNNLLSKAIKFSPKRGQISVGADNAISGASCSQWRDYTA
jgi:signal transduction histidine kinase